tara:strand:+ start:34049 stop:34531 length:483 start_codon:yes stop_codon:yes gene_type:complete
LIPILRYQDLEQASRARRALRQLFLKLYPQGDVFAFLEYYYQNYPECFYLAMKSEQVLAYLAICPDTSAALAELKYDYYHLFSDYYQEHPAHLHINVDPSMQGQGLGSRLLDYAKKDLAKSLHAIVAKGEDNVHFYLKNGFQPVAVRKLQEKELIFLSNH